MIFETHHRAIPERDAFFRRRSLRHELLRVVIFESSRLATDFQLLAAAVPFMSDHRGTQVTLILEGRGYFASADARFVELRPGDGVLSDQLRLEPEGYGGAPCLAVVIEWTSDIAPAWRSPSTKFHLSPAEIARAKIALAGESAAELVGGLLELLRAHGLPFQRDVDLGLGSSGSMSRWPAVASPLGKAFSRLETSPCLTELAAELGVSERQANRYAARCAPHAASFRDLMHDARVEAAIQALSLPRIPLERVAALSGYRSAVALCHAFARSGLPSPAQLSTMLRERWG